MLLGSCQVWPLGALIRMCFFCWELTFRNRDEELEEGGLKESPVGEGEKQGVPRICLVPCEWG